MRGFLGGLMIVTGIALGLYVGFWICLVGGILDIVYSVRGEAPAFDAVWGGLKFVCAGLAGWASAALLILPGLAVIGD